MTEMLGVSYVNTHSYRISCSSLTDGGKVDVLQLGTQLSSYMFRFNTVSRLSDSTSCAR